MADLVRPRRIVLAASPRRPGVHDNAGKSGDDGALSSGRARLGDVLARVAVAGHLCLDLTPELTGGERLDPGHLLEVGPLSVRLGGSVANTGGDLVDLGLPVDVVATVGDDDLGVLLLQMLGQRPGMTPRLRQVRGSASSYSLVF